MENKVKENMKETNKGYIKMEKEAVKRCKNNGLLDILKKYE